MNSITKRRNRRARDSYESPKNRRAIHAFKRMILRLEHSECMHENCPDCQGTGRKQDGTMCIHYISCPCKKCTIIC